MSFFSFNVYNIQIYKIYFKHRIMRVDQLEALSILCFEEGEDKSRFIRKMFDMAIEIIGKENGRDYRAEAEARARNIK